jgi:hypothetical protein
MSRLLLLAFLLPLAGVSSLFGNDFSEFRVPKHQVYAMSGSLVGTYYGNSQDQGLERLRHWESHGAVSGWGYWLFDSDSRWTRLRATANVGVKESADRSSGSPYPEQVSESQSSANDVLENWLIEAENRWYPFHLPIGFAFSGYARAGYVQRWFSSRSLDKSDRRWESLATDSWHAQTYDYSLEGRLQIGWGRVRDATSVYQVHLFEKRLRESGALTRPLLPKTQARLASLLYFEGDYADIHDRPMKFFWEAVESILKEDSAYAPAGITAWDLYRLDENVFGAGGIWGEPSPTSDTWSNSAYHSSGYLQYPYTSRFLRERGWFLGLAASEWADHDIEHIRMDSRAVNSDSGEVVFKSGDLVRKHTYDKEWGISLGPVAEYHLPLGWRWQLDATAEVMFPLYEGARNDFLENADLTATYILADRWEILFGVSQTRNVTRYTYPGRLYQENDWSCESNAELAYYIEDHLIAALILSQGQYGSLNGSKYDTYPDFSLARNYSRTYYATVGLTYHFAGLLDAPGIVPPSTLLPWPAN